MGTPCTDVENLAKSIMDLVTNGIPFDVSNVGMNKDELDFWHLGLLKQTQKTY